MKKIHVNLNNNPSDIQGLYFFTQCLIELLFDHTNDSYKAPALNLVSRAIELGMMADHVNNSDINTEAMRSFLDEFEWGLNIDPVISHDCKSRLVKGLSRITIGTPSTIKISSFVEWARDELSNYFENLKKCILDAIKKPNEKAHLRKLAISFAAHIELRGYSRRYAYKQVCRNLRRKLSLKNITFDVEKTMLTFFNGFNGTDYNASVYFRGEATFNEFQEIAQTWEILITEQTPIEIISHSNKYDFIENDGLSTIIKVALPNKVKDHFMARDAAEELLNRLIGMIKYHCHDKNMRFSENAIIITKTAPKGDATEGKNSRSIAFIVGKKPNPTLNRFSDGSINHIGINRLAELIRGRHLDNFSTRKFNNALEYHRNALTAPGLENQLISLWSALEGLLPQPDSNVRIKHFTEIVSCILVLAYPKKLFKEIARQLKSELEKQEIQIIEKIGFSNWIENVIALICCPNFVSERDHVLSKLDNHPLLRFRLKELFDGFSVVKNIKTTLENHKKKVSWHINRIYMTRNLIVHSAESMPYLEIIVENLHDYLDTVIDAISYYAIKTTTRLSIDSLVEAILTDYQIRFEYLAINSNGKNCTSLDQGNFLDFIHGKNNVIDLAS